MFVSDWMTRKVFTVAPDEGVSAAVGIIREKKVKHIPVARDGRIKGIVSDRDIRDFTPSRATSLDIYELHYLLEKTKIREIMKKDVVTIGSDAPIEEAALLMYEKCIGCLPVLEDGRICGIISDRDIFRALVDITGVRHGGHRISLIVEDRPGSIREVADVIRKYDFSLQGILTSYEHVDSGFRKIVIRAKGAGQFGQMKAELTGRFRSVRIKKG